MKTFRTACLFALFSLIASAQTAKHSGHDGMGAPPDPSGLDLAAMDKSVSPCENFYQYSCGTWMKNNPIPADESRWGRFNELQERNRAILRSILEEAASKKNRDATEQKIGDYYASCMDESAVNAKGTAPLKPYLDRINGLTDKSQLADVVAFLHKGGINPLFDFGSGEDFKNASIVIAQVDQGGLRLPDRDYYLKTDAESVKTRQAYVAHVQKMLELLGHTPAQAAKEAAAVMKIETELAKGSLDRVSRRDPAKNYHKEPTTELAKLAPAFNWNRYITDMEAPRFSELNVSVPAFFQAVNTVIANNSLDDLKTYLTWNVIAGTAAVLPDAFVNESFNFNEKTLRGVKELRPRWKRCVAMIDSDLPEALGKIYVQRTFGAEGKARTLEMVRQIEGEMQKDLEQITWMSPATKQKALEKLHAVTNKIGYPDKWRDYSKLEIVRGDLIGDSLRSNAFEVHRVLNKINKPTDRSEWDMSPPTVNAYYNPVQNNINFPAGILQPPFYDNRRDDAPNYGGIGSVIGHELTHGFDDEGRQFDAKGNFDDWWTPADAEAFKERANCISDEYAGFVAVADVHLNGKLTLGENTADNGGLRLAHMALMDSLAKHALPVMAGYTPQQRFFIGFAQIWCQNVTPQAARLRALTDPHSPGEYRVNGTIRNMPEFDQAFGCKVPQKMVSNHPCRVW